MNPVTRRRVENHTADCLLLAAIGLRVGLWFADHAAFFLPKVTLRRLAELDRQAKHVTRQERVA